MDTVDKRFLTGQRALADILDVDSGIMAISRHIDTTFWEGLGVGMPSSSAVLDGVVVSNTGLGDGSYRLCSLRRDGRVVGAEIFFLVPEGEQFEDDWETFCHEMGDPSRFWHPVVLGNLRLDAVIGCGDPCYHQPSAQLRVEPGEYQAIAWLQHVDYWGDRVACLGVYLFS